MPTPTDARFHITRAQGDLLLPAATRLARASSGLDHAGQELLNAAKLHAISFRYFWTSTPEVRSAVARQACLVVPGAGRTGMLFTTKPENDAEVEELSAVIDHACRQLPPKVVRLAQSLVEPGEATLIKAHERGGVRPIATLLYLKRELGRGAANRGLPAFPEGIELTSYRPGRDEKSIVGVLPRTYEGTLDCPELSHTREPSDVLASHRAAGAWTPSLWWLIKHEGKTQGVALFNPIPEQDALELVYFGITPALRGRGLGRVILEHAIVQCASRPERWLTCACDERNTPALRMYGALGMRETERRVALVRLIDSPDVRAPGRG